MKVDIAGEQALHSFAHELLDQLTPKKDQATVIGLEGELGAGKTTFVQQVADNLGVDESVTSPTYVIVKKYDIPNAKFETLIHVDAYRLKNGQELEQLNWQQYLQDPRSLIFVEWPAHTAAALPEEAPRIRFEVVDEDSRAIYLDGFDIPIDQS